MKVEDIMKKTKLKRDMTYKDPSFVGGKNPDKHYLFVSRIKNQHGQEEKIEEAKANGFTISTDKNLYHPHTGKKQGEEGEIKWGDLILMECSRVRHIETQREMEELNNPVNQDIIQGDEVGIENNDIPPEIPPQRPGPQSQAIMKRKEQERRRRENDEYIKKHSK